jgi:hypothetical protein
MVECRGIRRLQFNEPEGVERIGKRGGDLLPKKDAGNQAAFLGCLLEAKHLIEKMAGEFGKVEFDDE